MTKAAGALASVVDALVSTPVEGLCAAEQQALVAAVVPQVDRLVGLVSLTVGALHARTGGTVVTEDGGARSVAGWLADTQRSTPQTAGGQVRIAARLRELPLVADAVLDGVVGPAQAAVLTRLVGAIPADVLTDTQPELVEVAAMMDPHSLGLHVAHLIATHCEPALDADERTAAIKRYLSHRRETDGRLTGRFSLTREDSEALLTALEPLARSTGLADGRSAGQRRADALVEVCELALRFAADPDRLGQCGGQRPQLTYLLPADWAARQADQARCPDCSTCPAHRPVGFADTLTAGLPGQAGIPGQGGQPCDGGLSDRGAVPAEHGCAVGAWSGPQTRARIEALLCEARISRVLLSPAGQVTGLESLTDEVTRAQRRALAARDLGCVARGCTRPPAFCDAHHLTSRADGGKTELNNLVLLCRRHHVMWHQGRLLLRDLHVLWLTSTTGTGADPPRE